MYTCTTPVVFVGMLEVVVELILAVERERQREGGREGGRERLHLCIPHTQNQPVISVYNVLSQRIRPGAEEDIQCSEEDRPYPEMDEQHLHLHLL